MTINFYLNNDPKAKDTEKIIFAYVRDKGKTITIHTGERINPKYWNQDKQQAKKNYSGSAELNDYLVMFKEEIKKVIRTTFLNNPEATFDQLKSDLNARFKKKANDDDFFKAFDLFISIRKNELASNSIKKFETLKFHLTSFQEFKKFKITFDSIDLLFYDTFIDYLINHKNHTNNTIHKNIGFLKIFMSWCIERKLTKNIEYLKFKAKAENVDIVYLTEQELLNLYYKDLSDKATLQKVRDVFCFACFTGQRFSDVSSISRKDIRDKFWHLRTTKTKDIIKIPLNDFALEILSRYPDKEKPLPVLSSQKTNKYLKELCLAAEINEPITIVKYRGAKRIEETYPKHDLITTHTARRTFVTLSLEKGMRHETLMEITGHKDYKTFKKYIKITNQVKTVEMNKIWKIDTEPGNEPALKIVNL